MPYLGKSPFVGTAETAAKVAAYAVIKADDGKTILCSAASENYSVSLAAAATLGNGFTVTISKSDSSKFMVTIDPSGSETISGMLQLKLRQEHASVTLICDGSNFHIRHHSNIAVATNVLHNSAFTVDQYSHITRSGLQNSSVAIQDRWVYAAGASPPAIWTYSNESNGGTDAKSKWGKWLCTTGGSPDATDHASIRQTIIGNNGSGFLGTDGLFENAVLSMDVIGHLNTPDAPYVLALGVKTLQGTARQYIGHVTITADAVWQRVSLVIPEDSVADIDPGTGVDWHISVGLIGGSSRLATANTWENNVANVSNTSGSQNWGATANNYLGITNVVLAPSQIPPSYESVSRTYEEELEICKYYFEKRINSNTYSPLATSFNRSTTIAAGFYGYTEKRVAPTIAFSGATEFGVTHGASADTQTSAVTAEEIHPTGCRVKFTVGSGLTAGEGSLLANWNNTSAYITISAEGF